MNTGTLAQVPASADPVHRAEPSQAHPGSLCVPPYPWAEPSSSSAWHVLPSSQHTLPALIAGRPTSYGLPTHLPPLHNRRYPSQHIALSSLAIPPLGLPTGSKADASFEATGELSTWPCPSGISPWRVGKNTDHLLLSPDNRWNNTAMDDLTYTLRQLCLRNRDGSHATQADRQRSLNLAARQLREAGFRQMRATSLKGKH